jgi:2-polyprenyl-3-methyl-5-hydroxy-6-metoxy-1,4-benzoquinol methylase
MSIAPTETAALQPWIACLDLEGQEGSHYHDYVNEAVLHAIEGTPRAILDLGCAGGMLGLRLKERFPGARVVGVEAGRAAAELAATRLDQVIHARIESCDFTAHGIAPGSIDLVIAADVLEHLANPWGALQRVRACLAPDARLVASIPNVRNLQVVTSLLLNGRWEYAERGLLDVTHLRFFTFEEIRTLFASTGYALESFLINISPALKSLYHEHLGKDSVTLTLGRMVLRDVTQRELAEFCAEQFVLRARLA